MKHARGGVVCQCLWFMGAAMADAAVDNVAAPSNPVLIVVLCVAATAATIIAVFLPNFALADRKRATVWQIFPKDITSLPYSSRCNSDQVAARNNLVLAFALGGGATLLMCALYVIAWLDLLPAEIRPWRFHLSNPLLLATLTAIAIYRAVGLKRSPRVLTLSQNEVSVRDVYRTGNPVWSEPLANYTGILGKTVTRTENEADYDEFLVELAHPDPGKAIRLLEQPVDATGRISLPGQGLVHAREVWKAYAVTLKVPALEETDGQVAARQAADLNVTALENVRDGKVTAAFSPDAPLPEDIALRMEDNETVLTLRSCNDLPYLAVRILCLIAACIFGLLPALAADTLQRAHTGCNSRRRSRHCRHRLQTRGHPSSNPTGQREGVLGVLAVRTMAQDRPVADD